MKQFILKTVMSVSLFAIAIPMVAQDETDKILGKYQKAANDRDSLSRRVKLLEKQLERDTTKLKNRYKQILEQQKKQFEVQIGELKRDTTAKGKTIVSLKRDIDKQINDKSQKAVDELKQQIDDLVKDTLKFHQLQRDQDKKLADAKSMIDSKEKELQQLRPFRKQMLEQMLAEARQWSSKPFSELDPVKVAKLLSDCREYGGNDSQFKDAASRVQQLQKELAQFKEANELLNRPYNEQSKNNARANLKQLINKYAGKPQLAELKTVDELLRDYDGNVLLFQQLITEIDKEIAKERESKNRNGAREMLKLALEDDVQKEAMESIKTVPYLARLLKKYLDDLSSNPIIHSSVEQEVKQMLP